MKDCRIIYKYDILIINGKNRLVNNQVKILANLYVSLNIFYHRPWKMKSYDDSTEK